MGCYVSKMTLPVVVTITLQPCCIILKPVELLGRKKGPAYLSNYASDESGKGGIWVAK